MRRVLEHGFHGFDELHSIKNYEVKGGESACFVASWECICAMMA